MPDKIILNLELKLMQATTQQQGVDARNALAWELRRRDLSRSMQLSQEAFKLAAGVGLAGAQKNDPYPKGMADSLLNLAVFHDLDGTLQEGLETGLEALAI